MSSQALGEAPVPVALFVYRRHEQLQRTLECLRACAIPLLYVFSDGAKGESDAEDVAKVRALLGELDWIEPVMFASAGNVGLTESIVRGLSSVFETHASAIVIEDDVCVAPEFYDYARLALRHYQGSELIAGVTGLRYPFDRRALQDHRYDVFLAPRFSSWGWATWRDRWAEFCFDASALRQQLATSSALRPERAGADMPGMIDAAVVEQSVGGSWDVFCNANMLLRNQYFVTPTWNMVENTGLAEGTHFDQAPPWELHWEPARQTRMDSLRFAPVAPAGRVLKAYRRFFTHQDAQRGVLAQARLNGAYWRSGRSLRRSLTRLAADSARSQEAAGVGGRTYEQVIQAS